MNEEFNTPANPSGEPKSKGMSIAALVCGILGIVGCFCPLCKFNFVLAILAIVFGAKAMKTAKENQEPTGMAVAGLVLGIIGVVMGVLSVLCVVCALGMVGASSRSHVILLIPFADTGNSLCLHSGDAYDTQFHSLWKNHIRVHDHRPDWHPADPVLHLPSSTPQRLGRDPHALYDALCRAGRLSLGVGICCTV